VISIVIPCYNEEAVLPRTIERLTKVLEPLAEDWEVLCVDDGSRDETWQILTRQYQLDSRWRALQFARNFGHQAAVSAGIHYALGKCLVLLDSDLQDPPELIPELVAKWREGNEVVYAIRRKRKEGFLKRFAYKAFYRVLAKLSETEIQLDSGDFCLLDRKVIDVLKAMPERRRFIRGLRAWAGFRQTGVEYERHARAAGEPKYTLPKLMGLAFDGIFTMSALPLRFILYLGLSVSMLSMAGAIFTLVQRIFAKQFEAIHLEPVPGFATIVIAIFFLGGVQLVCLGVIGEYLGRIYEEVKQRPCWVVRDTLGSNGVGGSEEGQQQ
jgi:polyisoprenyl-phosphate glycosyltransferase